MKKNFAIEKPVNETPKDDKLRSYYESGKLKSVCQLDEHKKKHGVCTSFYETGKIKTKITYEHGEKIRGISHYESGSPAYDIKYKNRQKNGLRTRFFENGQIASQFNYKNNNPGKGLIEYSKSGKQLIKYPELKIVPIDLVDTHGKYILEIYFSFKSTRGEYFVGELEDSEYLITGPNLARLKAENGKARYEFTVPKGMFLMEKLNFIGKYKTPRGNPYIVEKSFNLAIDNPL